MSGENYSLRDYQQECVDAVLSDYTNGHRRVAAQLPTAAGKTIIALNLMQRLPGPALALAHTDRTCHDRQRLREGRNEGWPQRNTRSGRLRYDAQQTRA